MRGLTLPAIFSAALLSACDRVSTPRALVIADSVEQKLWTSGPAASIGVAGGDANYYEYWRSLPDRSAILVGNNGAIDKLDAAVIERVFIPPAGGGVPVSRRTLVAWRENVSYGIMTRVESNADDSTVNEFGDDPLHPHPSLDAPRRTRLEDRWIPGWGKVRIELQDTSGTCPFDGGGNEIAADGTGRLSCSVARYVVQLDAYLVRRADARNSLLDDALKEHHRIFVPPQFVQGIRFTVHCPPSEPVESTYYMRWYAATCFGSPFTFWYKDTLFASSLDVDLKEMKPLAPLPNPDMYGRTLREGSVTPPNASRIVRWTLSDPSGEVIERDSTTDFLRMSKDLFFLDRCAEGYYSGRRRQCLVPKYYLSKVPRDRYRVYVLDMEDVMR